jgi:hypothetical protein
MKAFCAGVASSDASSTKEKTESACWLKPGGSIKVKQSMNGVSVCSVSHRASVI